MEWPKVSVLLALYEPRQDWLREQLASLVAQDYAGELEVLAYNDAPWSRDCEAWLSEVLGDIPCRVYTAEQNGGSTAAFAFLTERADGEVLAYCDQDDVWLPDKLTRGVAAMREHKVSLCFGDAIVMAADGRIICSSLQRYRPRQWVPPIERMQRELYLRNFVQGAAMLVDAAVAKAALPFPAGFVHDHWLALAAVRTNGIFFMQQPVMRYRLHGDNQSGVLAGICNRQDYYEQRVCRDAARLERIRQRWGNSCELAAAMDWMQLRKQYLSHPEGGTFFALLDSLGRFRWQVTLFELFLPCLPGAWGKWVLHRMQRK